MDRNLIDKLIQEQPERIQQVVSVSTEATDRCYEFGYEDAIADEEYDHTWNTEMNSILYHLGYLDGEGDRNAK